MTDDYEWCDDACPKCGHAPSHTRSCSELGCEDGAISAHEYDPVNYGPDEYETCRQCRGTGIEHWCPKCGYDFVWKRGGQTETSQPPAPALAKESP